MFKKILRVAALSAVVVALVAGSLVAYARFESQRALDLPAPNVKADLRPEALARGAAIFHATCEACHRPIDGDRASGAPITDAPSWIGSLHSGNITSDPVAGIGGLSDAQRGRMIRTGRNRHGHWAPMPTYALSDSDLAAVLGFLRSGDPLFAPDPTPAPRSTLTLLGSVVLLLADAFEPPEATPAVVPVPEGPSVAYGRYLAEEVYKCGDCHTPGFDADKSKGPEAYIGGGELNDAAGKLVHSPNLTQHAEAGIGRWSRDQFAEAVRTGIRPDGRPLGYPMPIFRGARDVEIDALLAYLRSFPASPNVVRGRVPAVGTGARPKSPPRATGSRPPQQLFGELGCVVCHAAGAPFEDRLRGARGRPTVDVAAWILHPERFRPGTAMPTFAGRLSDDEALALADWVQRSPKQKSL